ncbi:class I SAM-dependent methyltransferase [Methylobacterium sp. J-070]|uniref:class I SAM-dependent methyltransferase n=1 Tax=Methylobacterium sp. J-070 TaxID=2836650 RepID=UPI001FB8DFEB|nr:class I SAM-dependent methyltransferase [Methylobacterium sp. J-070]MCJ2053174.1 class I SAM-dependent methyltransferase [Methylobacterium sp. J-070]
MLAHIAGLVGRLDRRGATALDFGCASRPYEPLFRRAGITYRGADFGTAAEIAIGGDGRLPVADASVDLVLSFQVLEHVRDLDTYLGEARRVLRRDGLMVLSTHGTWLYHPHPEDHRRWTREGLTHDLAIRGFDVVECVPIVGPLAWTTILRSTGASYVLRRVPILGPILAGGLAVAMNLRAWLEDAVTPEGIRRDNACVYLTVSRPRA